MAGIWSTGLANLFSAHSWLVRYAWAPITCFGAGHSLAGSRMASAKPVNDKPVFIWTPKMRFPVMNPNYAQPQTKRPQILLPSTGRPESVFATELGQVIGPTERLFCYDDRLVEIIEEDFTGQYD